MSCLSSWAQCSLFLSDNLTFFTSTFSSFYLECTICKNAVRLLLPKSVYSKYGHERLLFNCKVFGLLATMNIFSFNVQRKLMSKDTSNPEYGLLHQE